ncbi:MAG: hypothetical protein GXO03_02045 [Aquificae bacterium]|nr:hypothetical protein [Aquificota bacterium]
MKVLVVKNGRQKERALRRLLKGRKVVAVVSSPEELGRKELRRADVVLIEGHEKDSSA